MKKILFINKGDGIDYQCDCLYHGLCCLDDVYVETLCDYWYMYEGNSPAELKKLYGKGFSIANRIPKSKQHVVSESDVLQKIREHFYDYVIYGSIHRELRLFTDVVQYYAREEIALVDGDDFAFTKQRNPASLFLLTYSFRTTKRCLSLAKKAVYFKRELEPAYATLVFPISFAIPEENIIAEVPVDKTREQAVIYPGDVKTYIYENEADYNAGYQEAEFGVTFKKAGWDCLRHYEILSNGCIPYFPDIAELPLTTMVPFPRHIIAETNRLRDAKLMNKQLYAHYARLLLSYTKENLTTKRLAEYVLSVLRSGQ